MDVQNYETWLQNKDEIGEFYDARVTLEQSHALEEIERLELFIAQAGMKIEEMGKSLVQKRFRKTMPSAWLSLSNDLFWMTSFDKELVSDD